MYHPAEYLAVQRISLGQHLTTRYAVVDEQRNSQQSGD
jgi:hypothetical protein